MREVSIVMTNSSNLHALDYASLASSLYPTSAPIVDIHTHIHGEQASLLYRSIAERYGIGTTYSMTLIHEVPLVKKLLGESIQFIAMPDVRSRDRLKAFGEDYLERIQEYRKWGTKIVKFWNAPRIYEASDEPFVSSPLRLDAPVRLRTMQAVMDAEMICMAHIGDPDTWFATKYTDHRKYGTKLQQYEVFEEVLEKIQVPWIAAHMGGYPEDLEFLSGLLERHHNLFLDCSATKWIVRELSKHPAEKARAFFTRWQDRIIFGSDIVTSDAHLCTESNASEMDSKASSEREAHDLYASRYWALRTLLETEHQGSSPISDPDLHLVDPEKYTPRCAPALRGFNLPPEVLEKIYWKNATRLLQGVGGTA
jgi:predicted TIM-barrel fold metal-dependent hydrolase